MITFIAGVLVAIVGFWGYKHYFKPPADDMTILEGKIKDIQRRQKLVKSIEELDEEIK